MGLLISLPPAHHKLWGQKIIMIIVIARLLLQADVTAALSGACTHCQLGVLLHQ
jgi:hypothetical protein